MSPPALENIVFVCGDASQLAGKIQACLIALLSTMTSAKTVELKGQGGKGTLTNARLYIVCTGLLLAGAFAGLLVQREATAKSAKLS